MAREHFLPMEDHSVEITKKMLSPFFAVGVVAGESSQIYSIDQSDLCLSATAEILLAGTGS